MKLIKDLLTGENFIPRRSNQKFASSINRTRYNNRNANDQRKLKAPVNRKLDQNRTIMKKILKNRQEIEVSKDFLLGAGFDFSCYTQIRMKGEVPYCGIFEYGIYRINEDKYKLNYFNNG